MMCLHMEGWMVSVAKMHDGYTWRSDEKCNQKVYKLHMECCKDSNLKFMETLSTPWHGAVNQDWRSKLCAPKYAS